MQQASKDNSNKYSSDENEEEEEEEDEDEGNNNENSDRLTRDQVENNNNGPGNINNLQPDSPRRKKPPLDLDAALYLQSTATLVQEPNNRCASGGGTSGKCSVSPKSFHQSVGSVSPNHQNSPSPSSPKQLTQTTDGAHSQLVAGSQQLNFATQSTNHHNQFAGRRRQTFDYYDINYYSSRRGNNYNNNNNNNNYYYYNNNISVDYIDCLSNNDLVAAKGASVAAGGAGAAAMRAIPACRKHLRFHRNRVEPNQDSNLQDSSAQGQQATASMTFGTGATGDVSSLNGDESLNSFNSDSRAGNATSSVLYPISVSEAKKRTYFIGQLAQDSLLGHEELYRYFPNGRVSIFVCTWNQNRKRSPTNLNDLLLPNQLVNMPDIYAIGIQEAFSSQNDYLRSWEIELQTTLGPNHVLLHSCSLGVLHLSLFVRRDLIWFCSSPEESVYNSRSMPTNMIKTKGAISIAFRFFGTSFMFTNCHFPAHENKLKDRVDEYQRIINSIDLPKNLKLLKPRYLSNDSTARFDCVFFMGDLNFRLEQRTFDETIHILEDIFQQKEPSYEALTQNDELLKVMETNQAFHGFDECQIKFPPTYKFLPQTNKYDRQTKRVPSYTDRILFRSKRQRHIQCLHYDWLPQLLSSDHKPVYCLFDVLIRPGHERNMVASLNAGLFQRNIYLEALKRRAEDPESARGENGAGGSLICTIS